MDQKFQFPVRNSAGLDPLLRERPGDCMDVSIPRSEFSWFGLVVPLPQPVEVGRVSIPRSEFSWFGPRWLACSRPP